MSNVTTSCGAVCQWTTWSLCIRAQWNSHVHFQDSHVHFSSHSCDLSVQLSDSHHFHLLKLSHGTTTGTAYHVAVMTSSSHSLNCITFTFTNSLAKNIYIFFLVSGSFIFSIFHLLHLLSSFSIYWPNQRNISSFLEISPGTILVSSPPNVCSLLRKKGTAWPINMSSTGPIKMQSGGLAGSNIQKKMHFFQKYQGWMGSEVLSGGRWEEQQGWEWGYTKGGHR